MEEQLKTKMIYDPSRGFYYELKKKLSNAQRIEIARRRNQGEDLARILLDMNVLKGLRFHREGPLIYSRALLFSNFTRIVMKGQPMRRYHHYRA